MYSVSSLTVLLTVLFPFSFTLAAFQINEWQQGQGREAVIDLQNTPFAEYWNSLPLLHRFTKDNNHNNHNDSNHHLKVDGHSFQGRMAIYHYLINSIDDSNDLWGETSLREYHWLWAYAAQLDWQNRSRRLQSFDEDPSSSDTISPKSWWGYMNFGFSVAILLGWKQTRPDITIELDSVSQHLIEHDKAMQKCIRGWESFFRHGYREFVDTFDQAPNLFDARYKLQHRVWEAHTSVIDYCQNDGIVYSTLLDKLASPERRFGEGWARMVHVLAAACFPTDLVTLKQDGGGFLPLQPLTTEVWTNMPRSNYFDACRHRTVLATHDLVAVSSWHRQGMISFWKRVAQHETISRLLPRTIVDLYHGTLPTKLLKLARLIKWFFRPYEWIALVGAVGLPFIFKMLR